MELNTLVDDIFNSHYQFYSSLHSETIKQQAGQMCQVEADYQGRVLYELIQNAVDRADHHIKVVLEGKRLLVGNDGQRFTFRHNYDYQGGSVPRGDFQALCSISTSAKEMKNSIGNKGVGFKSTFSASATGYVNVHTSGQIIGHDTPVPISFRLYNLFDNKEEVSRLPLADDIKGFIDRNIDISQKENSLWGVPGYYFPIKIPLAKEDKINDWFEEGFVTVIEIPVEDSTRIAGLIEEIKKSHFRFIATKYKDKHFDILFEQPDKLPKNMSTESGCRLFTAQVLPEVMNKAKAAGIKLSTSAVSVYFRSSEELKSSPGRLYNYLATNLPSPFEGVDFNADFYTTVDRKSINMDGPVGDYNRELLKACYQLYFSLLVPDISFTNPCIEVPESTGVLAGSEEFQWKWIRYNNGNDNQSLEILREILHVAYNDNSYTVDIMCKIAAKYFSVRQVDEEGARMFFDVVIRIAWSVIHYYNCSKDSSFNFLKEVGRWLKTNSVQVLPDADIKSEILYRRKDEKGDIILPEVLGINITSFEVGDDWINKGLGISKFNEYSEVYKYFKQCSNDGQVRIEQISEDVQLDLFSALCALIRNSKERERCSTDRMRHFYTSQSRENYRVVNQAAFALSTLFYKTIDGKYKPGQLLRCKDIDAEFLDRILGSDEEKETLLKMTGVSFQENFFYADRRIFDSLDEGLDYLPALIDVKSDTDKLQGKDILANITVFRYKNGQWIDLHPSVINPRYDFLKKVPEESKLTKELDRLLVRQYVDFPDEYVNVLVKYMSACLVDYASEIIQFYQRYAPVLFIGRKHYLIMKDRRLSWTDRMDFFVVESKSMFELWTRSIPGKAVLCYTAADGTIPQAIHPRLIKPRVSDCSFKVQGPDNEELKELLYQKIIYLIYLVSNHAQSEINYLDDNCKLKELRDRLQSLCIKTGSGLSRKVIFDETELDNPVEYAINDSCLYLEAGCDKDVQARAVSRYLFNNTSVADSLELVLFHKTEEELRRSVGGPNLKMLHKLWQEDYEAKWSLFKKELEFRFPFLDLKTDSKWFCFNAQHPSPVLGKVDEKGLLESFQEAVSALVTTEPYDEYFPEFHLEIDYRFVQSEADKLLQVLYQHYPEQECELVDSLKNRKGRLSNPEFVAGEIERLKKQYSDFEEKYLGTNKLDKDYEKEGRIEAIYRKYTGLPPIDCVSVELSVDGILEGKQPEHSGNIFQGEKIGKDKGEQCFVTGVQGEELVLVECIRRFIEECPGKEEQERAIRCIVTFVKENTNTPIRPEVVDQCYKAAGTPDITRALIPLCYYAMYNEYAPFDLVCFVDGMPKVIEVKSTSGHSRQFSISQREVAFACKLESSYELARVVDGKILFMGNPFPQLADKLVEIGSEKFNIRAKGYLFELKN